MKIAVLSDVHANFEALQAVTQDIDGWQPDLVVCAGDLINRGPRPVECLRFVWQRVQRGGWFWLRGNHEDYVLAQGRPEFPKHGPSAEVHQASRWTLERLVEANAGAARKDEKDAKPQRSTSAARKDAKPQRKADEANAGKDLLAVVEGMPYHIRLPDPNGNTALFTHGSMNGTRDGVYPETDDKELHAKIYPVPEQEDSSQPVLHKGHAARSETILKFGLDLPGEWQAQPTLSLFVVGHTHRPLVRPLNGALVVNAGSAGLPFDRDTRPSYARLEHTRAGWHSEIVRVEYDLQRAEQDFYTSGYLDGGGPLIKLVLIELQQARSQLFQWTKRYQAQALRGEMTMEQTVLQAIEDELDWE